MIPIDVSARAAATRARLSGSDALLVTDLTNLRWLTGFTGSNGFGVLLPDELVLVTDGRYGDQAQRQIAAARADSGEARVLVGRSGAELLDLLAGLVSGIGRLAFESAHVTYQQFVQFGARLSSELVPTIGVIESGRRTKDAAEVERMAEACAIADAALAEVAPTIRPGISENEIRNALEIRMRELGASGPSYETIVATGRHHAPLPHHRPTGARVADGDTVIIDVGALYDGYHSDMTRTFVAGTPTALQQEVYDVVLAAQRAGVAAVRPGVATSELDGVCRDLITCAGFGEWFIHGTGHGVGLLIHEDPFVNATGRDELQVGDVVTVEPGVYRGDFGGVRVEDLVLVTSTGGRVLTSSPKDSACLPSAPTN
jgi:Xaa-Pro aminopeptidase